MRLRQGRARRAAGTQVVVITDSTQGLGFGYAQAFLHRGHHVVISGHTQSLVDDAIDRLEADAVVGGGAAIGQACDVTDRAQLQSLWGFTVRSFGPVGIWLHNTDPARPGTAIGALNSAEVAVAGLSAQLHGGKLYLNLGCDGAIGRIVPGMTVDSDTQDELKRVADSLVVARHKTGDSRVLIGTISPGVSVTEGLLRELRALPPEVRGKALRVLATDCQGHDITWLTPARLLRRGLGWLFGAKRDLLARYKLDERGGSP